MRAVDAWAIEEQGVPQADLMERAGLGLARVTAAVAATGPVRIVVGKGNNGGDGLVAARLLREDGTRSTCCDGTEPFEPERLEGSGVVVDALLGTGFEGEPREPVASRDLGDQRAGRSGGGLRRALGRGRLDRRGRGGGGARSRDRDLPRLEGRPLRGARQAARGRVEVVEIGIPRGAPAPQRAGLISRARARPVPAPLAQRLEVRVRAWWWSWAARWGSPARRRWRRARPRARGRRLRAGRRARAGAAGRGPAPARADEPRAAGRRRLPHARGRGRCGGDGRARRRGGARPGPRPRRGRAGVRPRRGARRWRRRCWWTPTG